MPAHTPSSTSLLRGLVIATCIGALSGCAREDTVVLPGVGSGSIAGARPAFHQYGCTACHSIPGIVGADTHVGPPLDGLAPRKYLAGSLPNTPANLVRWIRAPRSIAPGTAMPEVPVAEQDAIDMAAYLYTLDEPE